MTDPRRQAGVTATRCPGFASHVWKAGRCPRCRARRCPSRSVRSGIQCALARPCPYHPEPAR